MKLNLCCGANVFPGWLNVDRTDVEADYLKHLRDAPKSMQWPPAQQELVDRIGEIQFEQHDVRLGLPHLDDGSVEAIYIGQAIEHFNRGTEAPALLRECARLLRKGGSVRLTTPDLRTIVEAYNQREMHRFESEQPDFYKQGSRHDQLSYLLFGAMGPDCTAQNYEGHFHIYTKSSLRTLLYECGLHPVDGIMNESMLFADTIDCGMSHSFAIEGMKP